MFLKMLVCRRILLPASLSAATTVEMIVLLRIAEVPMRLRPMFDIDENQLPTMITFTVREPGKHRKHNKSPLLSARGHRGVSVWQSIQRLTTHPPHVR